VKDHEARTRELVFDEAKRWPALDAVANVPNPVRTIIEIDEEK